MMGAFGNADSHAGMAGGSGMSALASRPFHVPTDEEVVRAFLLFCSFCFLLKPQRAHTHSLTLPCSQFHLREEEKRRRVVDRERLKRMQVADKSTFSSRMGLSSVRLKSAVGADEDGEGATEGRMRGRDLAAAATLPTDHRRREKENMSDFIAKKREIFLVQMSLDTKRAEIRKLEERALQREEALRKSEQMLDEDAQRFDDFLKENDERVQEAIKRAEVEAKAKQDRVNDIKRLNGQIAAIRSELGKYEEQLEDCQKYREFLDQLTPIEFFEEQEEAKEAAHQVKVKARADAIAKTRGEVDAARVAEIKKIRDEEEWEDRADARIAALPPVVYPPEPPEVERPTEETGEEPMYFQHPQQLLSIFNQLEEQNLFLIQNSQETEEALEELKSKYRDVKTRMDAETSSLEVQIETLRSAIAAEEDKARALEEKTGSGFGMGVGSKEHDKMLDELHRKVTEVYVASGFEQDASMGILQMLKQVESKLEEHLSVVETMPVEELERMEKEKEKECRTRLREEKMAVFRKQQELRIQKSLERSQAPVKKKLGKPMMYRSDPPDRKKKVDTGPKLDVEDVRLAAYLSRQFY